jgi:hypothetical protein
MSHEYARRQLAIKKPTPTKTRCYRCGEYCEWDGEDKTYPRLLDVKNPACPADAPMPKEFREDGV